MEVTIEIYCNLNYMARVVIFEGSSFDFVKYYSSGKIFKEPCLEVNEDLSLFLPYKKLNPIQTVYHKFYQNDFLCSIVSTPTSSGKSGIIYLTFMKHFLSNPKEFRGFIYTSPTKSLVEEKYNEFKNFYYPKNISVDIKTGDYASKKIDPSTKVICTTYDSLAIALRNRIQWMDKNFIVIDEVHSMISNIGKYIVEILSLAKIYQIPLVLLSATLPILNDLEEYLNPELVIVSNYRPVKLNRSSIFIDKKYLDNYFPKKLENFSFDKVEDKSILFVLNESLRRAFNGEKVIIFVWSKSIGWKFLKFASLIGLKIKNDTVNFQKNDEVKYDVTIAFHNADVPFDERRIIEEEFKDDSSNLRILIATQTLAMGVNLPADTAFINVKTYFGDSKNINILPSVLDILQEEGRVGRFSIRDQGNSFLVFWSAPNSYRNNLANLFSKNGISNFNFNLKDSFLNENFYNVLSILVLSSINLFGDERLIFNSIISNYVSKSELRSIFSEYIKVLENWGFIDDNKLTFKGQVCIYSNIPPHFLQGFFEMIKYKDSLKRHYLDFANLLAFRALFHTKKFCSYNDTYGALNYLAMLQEEFELSKNELKHLQELLRILVEDYLALFEFDKKNFERLYNGIFEYLAWTSGLIMQRYEKPIGEYSTISNDIRHLVYLLWTLKKNSENENSEYSVMYLFDKDLLKRYELSLIYGSNPNYSVMGKIRNIGHKRISLISRKLKEINVPYLDNHYDILNFRQYFYDSSELRSVLSIIENNLKKVST